MKCSIMPHFMRSTLFLKVKKIFRQKNAIFYDKKDSCMMLLREKHYYTDELVYLTYYCLDKFKKEDV